MLIQRVLQTFSALQLINPYSSSDTLCNCYRDSPDYSSVISRFERLIHDSRTPRKLSAFYALKLARFHAKTRNDRRLAEKIIRDAINRDKSNPQLYLALVDLAYTAPVFNERSVIEALNEVLESDQLSDEDKLRFSQRKLDFLEDLGTDVEALVPKLLISSDI
ncbi:hypothetical protein WUBG_01383 [Wuchereria bancrofti]|uniref:Uncharacterized protein n=1 Tax=Wuchereria bancrofti TaxID=6293 RepID=J9EZN6_WUCBA|nr:hypothetical protein WUBG_01383 [Wuchereria bancrofti]